MRTCFIFALYLLIFPCCTSKRVGRTVVKSSPIRRTRVSGSSSRLNLINYRFNRRPRRKNLDVGELKLALGSGFDPHFMSIQRPSGLGNQSVVTYVVREDSWRFEEMINQLQNSSLMEELQLLSEDRFRIQPEYARIFEKWLLKKASCPVKYAWEDAGPLFWPRYIRRGDCSTGQGTCSWPSGMHCVPSGTSTLTLLRWQCKTPKGKGGKGRRRGYKGPANKNNRDEEKPLHLKCGWVKVPYPITNECMCTC